jgi:hypothetical protein
VLNDFVHGMTGFRPSDCGDDLSVPVELEKPRSFDFSALLKMFETSEHLIASSGVILICIAEPDLLTTLASFVFEYIITGEIRGLGGPNGDNMVEFGLSRFKKSSSSGPRMAETDEPLAILGLVIFLGEHQLALETHLRGALNVVNASARASHSNLSRSPRLR